MSLLEQAKALKTGRSSSVISRFKEEELQALAIAALKGEISQKQFTTIVGVHSGSFAGTVWPILRRALAHGRLREVTK